MLAKAAAAKDVPLQREKPPIVGGLAVVSMRGNVLTTVVPIAESVTHSP
jgi:hypothetical protein